MEAENPLHLERDVFDAFRELAYRHAGIQLRDGKEALVAARVAHRVRALSLSCPEQYLDHVRRSPAELVRFLDAISTNFTSFFRESDHFDLLAEEARGWVKGRRTRVRAWCAASSTGEEPYTIAMTLAEALAGQAIDWRLLATDLSTRVLEVARRGRYPSAAVRQVPAALVHKYLVRREDDTFEVKPALGEKIVFGRLNLMTTPYPLGGPLDVVMCRNVMIYFDHAGRQTIVEQVERLLRPGGLFVVGHSETLAGVRTSLRAVRPSIYRKAPQ